MEKVKKVVASIIASLVALPVKVLGANELIPYFETNTYSGRPIAETIMEDGWNIVKILVIPITLLLGLLIYVKRKPESKIKKFLPAIITLIFSPLILLTFVFIVFVFKIN